MTGYNPMPNYQQQMPQSNSNIFWVQGEAGAKAYPVAPGNNIALWDSENQSIYIKVVDASGIPQPLRILDYTERAPEPAVEGTNYVTKEELDDKFNEILSLLKANNKPYNKKGGRGNGTGTT